MSQRAGGVDRGPADRVALGVAGAEVVEEPVAPGQPAAAGSGAARSSTSSSA